MERASASARLDGENARGQTKRVTPVALGDVVLRVHQIPPFPVENRGQPRWAGWAFCRAREKAQPWQRARERQANESESQPCWAGLLCP